METVCIHLYFSVDVKMLHLLGLMALSKSHVELQPHGESGEPWRQTSSDLRILNSIFARTKCDVQAAR
jgi:hypothetical protein